ncbi:NAD(P)-binding protein [Xylaria curta]|nr:NAD(P)-binding protein [Xylaria curta]
MRAWQYTRAGRSLAAAMTLNPNARRPPTPLPADRLLVRVTHMSPNPADHKVPELSMVASLLVKRALTATPGMDYAGVVEEVGSNINSSSYKVGDAVFGRAMGSAFGTLGEYIQPLSSGCVAIPPSVSSSDASTLGTAAQTAYQGIVPYVRAGAGDEVFVNGGSGGVGTYAIQIAAKALGCVVTTSCSGRNAELCKSLGASTVLDYTTTNVSEALRARGQVFKLVFDTVGNSPADLYKAADDYLLPDGNFVQVGAPASLDGTCALVSRALLPSALGGGKRPWKFFTVADQHEHLAELARWMQEGKIRAVIDGDIVPFEEAPKVYEKLTTGRTRGNLVVKVSE